MGPERILPQELRASFDLPVEIGVLVAIVDRIGLRQRNGRDVDADDAGADQASYGYHRAQSGGSQKDFWDGV